MDYNKYHLSVREIFFYIVEYALLIIIFGYTFYRSFFAIIIFSPGILLLIKKKKNQLCLKRKQQLQVEFKEGISAVAKGLLSGLSTENAFIEAVQEMQILYGKNGLITKEFMYIKLQLSMNKSLEECLNNFAERSGLEDICKFANVFVIAKRNSGNLVEIMNQTIEIINDKVEIEKEIITLLSTKKLEQKIMNVVPLFIIMYVGQSTGTLLDSLYNNLTGVIIMTGCLCAYILSVSISEKIVNIKV